MIKTEWTDEQRAVIEHRNGNLLVSAAAGAGKTAVLIERIMGRLLDEKNPINLDEFLVVTYTRAAAGEMRERIGRALEKRFREETKKNPDSKLSVRLMNQYALLAEAKISTIDSFCRSVVMENFHKTDLDPSFRLADETELTIIKAEVLDALLEKYYEAAEDDFINLSEYFDRGKGDNNLGEIILKLHAFSESFPEREECLKKEREKYKGSLFEQPAVKTFVKECKEIFRLLLNINESAIEEAVGTGGPLQYESALLSDGEFIRELIKAEEFSEISEIFNTFEGFTRLSATKPKSEDGSVIEVDEAKKERTKSLRERYKKYLDTLKKDFFFASAEEMEEDFKVIKRVLIKALELVEEFGGLFKAEKRRRNIADFSDLTHFALGILTDENGELTEAAKEYREQFAEIMIDEYQDSNLIQDIILSAISRESIGEPNIFMVGDVKQSIYKFRQARPELFLEKYKTYKAEGSYRKIDLHKNFRSGQEVIDSANSIFSSIMHEDLGGIEYDEAARLVAGRKAERADGFETEILLADKEEADDVFLSDRELEAHMVAVRIKKLLNEGFDYGDIVILLRSMKGWAEVFREVLISEGIPAVCESNTGYFSTWEIQVMLSLLSIIDNPRQDIPLAAVLMSPIGGFNGEELAEMRIKAGEKVSLWEAVKGFKSDKSEGFVKWLARKREEAVFTPARELIGNIYDETGFYEYVSAMPAGEARAANLDMLEVKAKEYEATSLHGVMHFIRYIDRLKEYDEDFGEAGTGDETEAVRIMTIHKSKGLEFPAVFVSGLAKKRNDTDSREAVIIHADYGAGAKYFNTATREEGKSLLRNIIARRIRLDSMAEEIRVLYVALTRARNKLILTAAVSSPKDKKEAWIADSEDYLSRTGKSAAVDLIIPPLLKEGKTVTVYNKDEIIKDELQNVSIRTRIKSDMEKLIGNLPETEETKELYRVIEKEFNYEYPFMAAVSMKAAVSVSELKREQRTETEAEPVFNKIEEEAEKNFIEYIPEFMREETKEALTGTEKGTLYHKVLSKISFKDGDYREQIIKILIKLGKNEVFTERDIDRLMFFFNTKLAERMRLAEKSGELFREIPFVMGVDEMQDGYTETVTVQGIIDVWFEESGELVLVDYKTDRVNEEDGERVLTEKYEVQLKTYKEALERLTGKRVKESLIYSFALRKVVKCG